MVLASGTRLGPYEISGPLGSGGMGEVYRARDSRLKRDVAVKVLPERFSHDPEALARFEREAVAVGHPLVRQDEVEGRPLEGPLRRADPLRLDDLVAVRGEDRPEDAPHVRFVVDDEEARHRQTPGPRPTVSSKRTRPSSFAASATSPP